MVAATCLWLDGLPSVMAKGSLAYIETEASLKPLPIPAHWEILRAKKAGNVAYYLVRL